uniref:Uncharacterized protein n=1 Tax=Triticum urartu TaxID=4572 RepID=A0A8R7PID1_TRIUA
MARASSAFIPLRTKRWMTSSALRPLWTARQKTASAGDASPKSTPASSPTFPARESSLGSEFRPCWTARECTSLPSSASILSRTAREENSGSGPLRTTHPDM